MIRTTVQRLLGALALASLLAGLSACAAQRAAPDRQACAKGLIYDDAPVSAEVIAAFEPYVSDRTPPIVTEINLSAARGSNQFAAESHAGPEGWVSAELPDADYAYRVVGCAHDTFVLATERAPAGGSAVLKSLLFVDMDTREAFGPAGTTRSRQTFISVTRRVPMGDRDTARVTMQGDTVHIGRSRYRETPMSMQVAGEQ